jgi:2'-5' RNA ligase
VTDWRNAVFDQLSFLDDLPPGPPVPPPMRSQGDDAPGVFHSVFFAAVADSSDAVRLHVQGRQIDRQLGVGGRALEAERLHVSLHAVGGYADVRPDADIVRWCRAAAAVSCSSFDVVFDQVASFGGEGNPLVFKSSNEADRAGFLALHLMLGMMLANVGEKIKPRSFTPHMTLSYRGKRIAETAIEPVRWRAHELVLIDSHVGAHRHDVLGRWLLRD